MGLPDLSGYSDHQLAALIACAIIIQVGGIALLILKVHGAGKDAKAAKDQTVATGNGFAGHVLGKLDKLNDSSAVLQRSVERVQDTQVEQREQLDFVKDYVQRVDQRQNEHIRYHASRERNSA